jgi:hypothetical protein
MIVTAHQPGYLPGVSVVAKLARADAVVWLDEARFTAPGFVNRNRLSDGTWLTVPVERENHRTPIKDVTIGAGSWADDHTWQLRERFLAADHYDPYFAGILGGPLARAGSPVLDLNLELIEWIIGSLGLPTREFRQSDYPARGGSFTSKLVRLVKSVGGTAYLSGPTTALDRAQFEAAGIELLFFRFAGPNPSIIEPLFTEGQLPQGPLQEVNVA